MQSTELKKEINNNTLSLIENTLWSMRALVCESQKIDSDTKTEYDNLFSILLHRYERLSNLLESNALTA